MEKLDDFDDLDAFFAAPVMPEGLPEAIEPPEEALTTLEVTFEALVAGLIDAPDDAVAFAALQKHIVTVRETGRIEQVMQMAMQLSALACSHDIFAEPARAASEGIGSGVTDTKEQPQASESEEEHDSGTCKACRAGKACSKRRSRLLAWLTA